MKESTDQDDKTYLGKLCKNRHEFKTSEKSLRYKSNRHCVECSKQRVREKDPEYIINYYKKNRDKIRIRAKQYYEENKEKILEKQKVYNEKNKEKRKVQRHKYWKMYYQKNKERIMARRRELVALKSENSEE